jgi:uncharacterized membrane protein
MNGAHWHLVVNHLPIIFPLVGVIVLVTGLISKSEAVKRTAFMIFIFGALASIAAMTTGEGAEEVVEKINGVTENYIKSHEERAETFALLSYILGGISLFGLWASFKQKTFSNIVAIAILVFAFVVLYFGKQTGTTGGEIRHTEIRNGNAVPANENSKAENDEDD